MSESRNALTGIETGYIVLFLLRSIGSESRNALTGIETYTSQCLTPIFQRKSESRNALTGIETETDTISSGPTRSLV